MCLLALRDERNILLMEDDRINNIDYMVVVGNWNVFRMIKANHMLACLTVALVEITEDATIANLSIG